MVYIHFSTIHNHQNMKIYMFIDWIKNTMLPLKKEEIQDAMDKMWLAKWKKENREIQLTNGLKFKNRVHIIKLNSKMNP